MQIALSSDLTLVMVPFKPILEEHILYAILVCRHLLTGKQCLLISLSICHNESCQVSHQVKVKTVRYIQVLTEDKTFKPTSGCLLRHLAAVYSIWPVFSNILGDYHHNNKTLFCKLIA